jgi:hypothetical protein
MVISGEFRGIFRYFSHFRAQKLSVGFYQRKKIMQKKRNFNRSSQALAMGGIFRHLFAHFSKTAKSLSVGFYQKKRAFKKKSDFNARSQALAMGALICTHFRTFPKSQKVKKLLFYFPIETH